MRAVTALRVGMPSMPRRSIEMAAAADAKLAAAATSLRLDQANRKCGGPDVAGAGGVELIGRDRGNVSGPAVHVDACASTPTGYRDDAECLRPRCDVIGRHIRF